MDVYRIASDLKFPNQIGASLNLEERMKLEIALLKLNETQKFEQILFWGRIEGVEKDYYIALGLNFKGQYEFPTKKFFWSSNDFKFAELPPINPTYNDLVETLRTPFTGKHETLIEEAKEEEDPQQQQNADGNVPSINPDEEEFVIKVPKKNFTELDRLSFVVRAIEIDCAALPIGAVKLSPTHELRYDDSFGGLSITEANQLSNYQHFRSPLTEEKKEYIARGDATFKRDFLDPLEKDFPTGSWSVQTDSSKTQVTVRSLLWPGYLTYHRANSNTFGYCYFGSGIKNSDLPFII